MEQNIQPWTYNINKTASGLKTVTNAQFLTKFGLRRKNYLSPNCVCLRLSAVRTVLFWFVPCMEFSQYFRQFSWWRNKLLHQKKYFARQSHAYKLWFFLQFNCIIYMHILLFTSICQNQVSLDGFLWNSVRTWCHSAIQWCTVIHFRNIQKFVSNVLYIVK